MNASAEDIRWQGDLDRADRDTGGGGTYPLVHVRTPTYRRPEDLKRCLQSLQRQTWSNWICDVFDDDPDASGRDVVGEMGDSRIRYRRNATQKFASANIDQCFSSANPHGADYFCVVEDDNAILPDFMETGIADCLEYGVEILLRDQLVLPSNEAPPSGSDAWKAAPA